ncbi:transporter [Methylohalobius crimeensis]|uniref:transporter n=1 Tax=Methylohalobius crimeensis TaxID=244365 RepID=UPI0003B3FC00|nr:transporter [Methylohalobius crimeensis]
MSVKSFSIFIGAAAGAISLPVFATHTSALALGAGTLSAPINTETAIPIPQGHFAGGVRTEFVKFNTLSASQLLEEEADESVDSLLDNSLLFAYGLTENLTLGVRLPFYRRFENIREGEEEGVVNLGDSDGIGDLIAFSQYRFLHLPRYNVHAGLILGLKTPSGMTDRRSREGERLEAELQPGSGSWDGIFGLSYTQNFAAFDQRLEDFTFNASAVYTVVTEGSQETDLGDNFSYNASLSYRLPLGGLDRREEYFFRGTGGVGMDLILEFNGRWLDNTRISGRNKDSSGGLQGYLSPGARLLLGRHTNVGVSFGIPVVDDLNGTQDNLDYRLVGTLNFFF